MKQSMTRTTLLTAAVLLAAALLLPDGAAAQVAGQRINPNIILLLDTGRGMNWIKETNFVTVDGADVRSAKAIKACDDMNLEEGSYTHVKTAWQTLVETHLGSSTDMRYQHCFYEDPDIRPYLHADTLTGIPLTGAPLYERMAELTNEYWKFNKEPHLRLINCYDPRETVNRGDWNIQYQQCIGEDIASIPGHEITTRSGRKYWCQDFVDADGDGAEDDANYVTTGAPLNRAICFNLHPRALPSSTDGILERYRSLARFSVMTFDNTPAPTQHDTAIWDETAMHRAGWDWGGDKEWFITAYEQRVPSPATKFWNAGIRTDSPRALGKLVRIGDDFENRNQEVRKVFDTMEPLHCSFDAALLDDVGEYAYHAPEMRPAYSAGADLFFNCRPKLVVFITDGIQTDSLEFPQAYCNKDNKAPPPPYPSPDETQIGTGAPPYTCPFNSTTREATELFRVVERLAANGGELPGDVEPMYMVVIGLNMRDKENGGNNRCDGTPVWDDNKGICKPPGDDCIALNEVNQANCNGASMAYREAYVTPRQYLNLIALHGWPDPNFPVDPMAQISPYVNKPAGTFQQPPWRTDNGSGTMVQTWCEDDPNMCGGEESDGKPNGALFVDSRQELSMVLDALFNGFTYDETATRTELVTTNVTAPASSQGTFFSDATAVQQYVFNSGYHAQAGKPWAGVLSRQGYACTSNNEGATEGGGAVTGAFVDFQSELRDRQTAANRLIYILNPALTAGDLNPDSNIEYKAGFPNALIPFAAANGLDDCLLGAPAAFCASNTDYLDATVDYLKGVSGTGFRAEKPLGDIYNSSPYILPPPRERVPINSYEQFKAMTHTDEDNVSVQNVNRQPYLYVGTNDGILHSFNVWAEDGDRIEGWGFVPTPLVENIDFQFPVRWTDTFDPATGALTGYSVTAENLIGSFQHIYGVDAPPLAADVLIYKSDDDYEKEYWRSLVLGGLGKGGYGYYCLDVTVNPETKPAYRWQLSPTHFAANTEAADQAAIGEMGLALSRPELAYVYYEFQRPVDGAGAAVEHQAAVAILPGGYISNETGDMEVSTGVYIVRAGDGRLVRYLKPTVDTDICDTADLAMFESNLYTYDPLKEPLARTAQLVGQPIVPNAIRTGKVADEAFIGDDRGRLWRIDMSDTDPANWCLEVFFSTLLAEHFPYRDCLNNDPSNPGAVPPVCAAKTVDVANPCSAADINGFMTDTNISVDSPSGAACTTLDYPFPRIPMMAPPTLIQDEDRNNVLLFGTGQIDGLATLNHNRVFSVTVTPEINLTATTATYTEGMPVINWWIGENVTTYPVGLHTDTTAGIGYIESQMFPSSGDPTRATGTATTHFDFWGLGEKMLGRIAVFNETAFFTSFTPLDKSTEKLDGCDAGGSKIWGVSFDDLTDFPKLPDEGGVGIMVPYYERDRQLLTGLRVVRRPACDGTEGFVLMVQKARPPASATTPGTTDHATAPITSETIPMPTSGRGFTRVGIDSWSIVLGGS